VRSRYKRQLIQLKMNKSGLRGLEWKTRHPYSLVHCRRFSCIADPPILSSSPRNGSGTAMNADLSLVEQSDSSACPARPLQNVPVRPPIAQSTPSFFCTFLRISQKISISQRLRAGCSLDTEGIGGKSQEKEGSRLCTEVAEGEPIGRLRFVLSSCLRLRLTNRWPVAREPYRQEPFLVDEHRIGGSAILLYSQFWPMWSKSRQGLSQLPIGRTTLSG